MLLQFNCCQCFAKLSHDGNIRQNCIASISYLAKLLNSPGWCSLTGTKPLASPQSLFIVDLVRCVCLRPDTGEVRIPLCDIIRIPADRPAFGPTDVRPPCAE